MNEILNDLDNLDKFQVDNTINTQNNDIIKLFNVNEFIEEIRTSSAEKNKTIQKNSNTISGYDIAHNCIRQTIFKIKNAPVENFADSWLPLSFRSTLGNAVHDFIQKSNQFTEKECSIRVPSINVSVRLDALINSTVLVEIKSCTYTDYKKIITSQKPRDGDFYQVSFYKYLLENYLQECKEQKNTRTQVPVLSQYNIKYLQLIYVAHDIVSSDCDSMNECIKMNTQIKKLLNSKYNPFHFITTFNIDLDKINIKIYEDYMSNKLNTINENLNNNSIPGLDNIYIDKKACFFCLYKNICSQYK